MTAMPALQILMTTDTVGGVWQYSTDLTRELIEAGHAVTLAVLGPSPSETQRSGADQIGHLRLVDTGLPLDWMCDDPAPVERAAREISRLASECGADIIHCNMPALAGGADFPVPLLAVTHGCTATWWQAARDCPLIPAYRWHRDMVRQGLAAADAVVSPSSSYAETVQATYRLPHRPKVVHNGRPPAPGTASGKQPIDAALTVGRMWDPVKNGALLDRVAATIALPFLAAGSLRGPHGEEAVFSHLQALGHVPDEEIGELLALQPIFVSAARFEPFGLAVLEAASAGCALILADIPTFRELWDGAALFVDPGDADGFARAIERLHTEPGLRQQLGETARLRSTRYTPAAMANAVASIYRALLAERMAAA
tara:strand:+ start:9467 stop:10576 length:1110 start_codon:yes stop_codon:yes gene_type:complete